MDRKGAIFLISARKNLLKTCLSHLDKNYNSKFNYPILIFYTGNKYDDESYRNSIKEINKRTQYSFHKLNLEIPKELEEKDMFWNLENNNYAKGFGKKRLGYLHANFFWNNFMNYDELKEYDYVMRIDDDSWVKKKIEMNFFEELERNKGYFGTGFTWNHYGKNHLETRHNLFNFIKEYITKYNIEVKNDQLRESLKGEVDNIKFHTMNWNLGNLNVYNQEMFKSQEWKQYNDEFNNSHGCYKYRWVDIEIIGLFAYIHLDNPLVDFKLKQSGAYDAKLPNTQTIINDS